LIDLFGKIGCDLIKSKNAFRPIITINLKTVVKFISLFSV
jgi:hypothetical protein